MFRFRTSHPIISNPFDVAMVKSIQIFCRITGSSSENNGNAPRVVHGTGDFRRNSARRISAGPEGSAEPRLRRAALRERFPPSDRNIIAFSVSKRSRRVHAPEILTISDKRDLPDNPVPRTKKFDLGTVLLPFLVGRRTCRNVKSDMSIERKIEISRDVIQETSTSPTHRSRGNCGKTFPVRQ